MNKKTRNLILFGSLVLLVIIGFILLSVKIYNDEVENIENIEQFNKNLREYGNVAENLTIMYEQDCEFYNDEKFLVYVLYIENQTAINNAMFKEDVWQYLAGINDLLEIKREACLE